MSSTGPPGGVVYFVQCLPRGDDLRRRLSGPAAVQVFADRPSAEADCAARERAAREGVNPFRGDNRILADVTSLPAPVLRDWLLDAVVEPPPPAATAAGWAEWWEGQQGRWAEWQREKVWEALDGARQYEVAERTARKAYVVVEIGWSSYGETVLDPDPEGGRALRAFATRGRAEASRAEVERRRKQQDWLGYDRFSLGARAGYSPHWYTLEEVPLYEVVEVDWEGATSRRVYLVGRRGLVTQLEGRWVLSPEPNRFGGVAYVPLRLFTDRPKAEEWANGLGRAARGQLNPFDLGYFITELTVLSEMELQERIVDLGLVPPDEHPGLQAWSDWRGWWEATVGTMAEAQRDGVWDLLDRLRLYEVFPLDLGE